MAVNRLGVSDKWDLQDAPLEATASLQTKDVCSAGLDDPLKIASVAVSKGVLCWCWIEEAYEVMTEGDFDMIDESIRGVVPDNPFQTNNANFQSLE